MARPLALTLEQISYIKELDRRGVSKLSIGRVVQHEQAGRLVNTSPRIVRAVLADKYLEGRKADN